MLPRDGKVCSCDLGNDVELWDEDGNCNICELPVNHACKHGLLREGPTACKYCPGVMNHPVSTEMYRMNKLIKDGKVAVLYSPGYGSGWYSSNDPKNKDCLFDPQIINLVLAKEGAKNSVLSSLNASIDILAEKKWPGFSLLGSSTLQVVWLPEGTGFRIDEYDGYETVELCSEVDWIIA
jgi:hypothetical protein